MILGVPIWRPARGQPPGPGSLPHPRSIGASAPAYAIRLMRAHPDREQTFVVSLSGRGDKNIFNVSNILEKKGVIAADGSIHLDRLKVRTQGE